MWKTKKSVFINIDKNLLFVIICLNPRPMNIVRIITLVIIMVTNFGSEARAQYVLPTLAQNLELNLEVLTNNSVAVNVEVPNPDSLFLVTNIRYSSSPNVFGPGNGISAATALIDQSAEQYGIGGFTNPLTPGMIYYFQLQIVGFYSLQEAVSFQMFNDMTDTVYTCLSYPVALSIDISTGLASIHNPTGVIACPEGIRVIGASTEEVSVYGPSGSIIYRGRPRGDGVLPLQWSGVMMVQVGQSRPIKIFRGT